MRSFLASRVLQANPERLCGQFSRKGALTYCNDEKARKSRKGNLDDPRCQEKLLGLGMSFNRRSRKTKVAGRFPYTYK